MEEGRRERVPKRYIRDYENPIEFYCDEEFKHRYRFTKHVTTNIILALIINAVQVMNNRGLSIAPIIKLLICLRYYATGNFQMVAGDLRGVSQATVSQLIQTISIVLAEQLGNYIKFSDNAIAQKNNIMQFHAMVGFPSVEGCINYTHIAISSPGETMLKFIETEKDNFL